ncbi:MAG: DUF1595 domain-containing protein, partial [Pirellulaceae bacterium]
VPELLRRFTERAYRRPVTSEEVDEWLGLYRSRLADGRPALEAYKDTLKAILCSPEFLYLGPPDASSDTQLSDHGLAERLSYFLTSTMPDDRLRAIADQARLSDPEVLSGEARRL